MTPYECNVTYYHNTYFER